MLPPKDGCFYSICYTLRVVSLSRNPLVSLPRNWWSACPGIWWSGSSESPYTRMNKVYNYVYNNISSPFDVSEVAGQLNMSISAFCHYFKKRTQKTFSQFINETRIGKAKRLLIETDKSIAEIAYESGYNSLSNFNKQFSSLERSSPKTFRKNY